MHDRERQEKPLFPRGFLITAREVFVIEVYTRLVMMVLTKKWKAIG